MQKKGFTLIEILVVVAIVGVMSSMLIGAIHKGREAGRRTNCSNNIRQIGMAFFMYIDENNDRFPRMSSPYWMDSVNRYIDNPKVWSCPDQPNIGYTPGNIDSIPFSYNYSIGLSPANMSGIAKKSETILLSDSTLLPSVSNPFYKNYYLSGLYIFGSGSFPAQRHSGGDNYIFADGHAKWCTYNEVWVQHGPPPDIMMGGTNGGPNNWWDLY